MPDEIKKPKAKGTWIPFLAVALFSTLVRYPIPTLVVVAILVVIYIASKKGRITKLPWSGGPGATIPSGGNSSGEAHPMGDARPTGDSRPTGEAQPVGNPHFDFGRTAEPTQPDDGSPARRVLLFAAALVAVGLVLYLIFGQG